jgi:HPt (histidine-containing phosphotransfer) domain-containing protein
MSTPCSSSGTHLIVSEGVTAMIASIIPAPKPANIDLGAESLPWIVHELMTASASCGMTHLVVLEHRFELIISGEPHTGLYCVPDDDRRTSRIQALVSSLAYRLLERLIRRQRLQNGSQQISRCQVTRARNADR